MPTIIPFIVDHSSLSCKSTYINCTWSKRETDLAAEEQTGWAIFRAPTAFACENPRGSSVVRRLES